jgi:hypothetical protein
MVVLGVGGVLTRLMGCMGWGSGRIYIYIYIYIKSVKGPQVHMKHTREATKLGGAKRTRKL